MASPAALEDRSYCCAVTSAEQITTMFWAFIRPPDIVCRRTYILPVFLSFFLSFFLLSFFLLFFAA